MKYQVTVIESTTKYVTVEADSIEGAKSKGYSFARDMTKPNYVGSTEISAYHVGDDATLGSPSSSISQ